MTKETKALGDAPDQSPPVEEPPPDVGFDTPYEDEMRDAADNQTPPNEYVPTVVHVMEEEMAGGEFAPEHPIETPPIAVRPPIEPEPPVEVTPAKSKK